MAKRSPYKGRQKQHDRAIELRHEGWGYVEIGKEVEVPSRTVANWVNHIKVDRRQAQAAANQRNEKPVEELISKEAIKRRLIRQRGHQCEFCLTKIWLGKRVTLEIHRVNPPEGYIQGNVQLLCPNCHALTPNWKNKCPPTPMAEGADLNPVQSRFESEGGLDVDCTG